MNNKQREEIIGNATLIAQAVANVHALRFAAKQSAFEKCRSDIEKDLGLAEIALKALTAKVIYQQQLEIQETRSEVSDFYWFDCDEEEYLRFKAIGGKVRKLYLHGATDE